MKVVSHHHSKYYYAAAVTHVHLSYNSDLNVFKPYKDMYLYHDAYIYICVYKLQVYKIEPLNRFRSKKL
jgi:hypothetical protein